jgi:hypothetical protein
VIFSSPNQTALYKGNEQEKASSNKIILPNTQHDSLQLRTINPQCPSTKPPTTSHNASENLMPFLQPHSQPHVCFRGRPRRLFCYWPPETSALPTPARLAEKCTWIASGVRWGRALAISSYEQPSSSLILSIVAFSSSVYRIRFIRGRTAAGYILEYILV